MAPKEKKVLKSINSDFSAETLSHYELSPNCESPVKRDFAGLWPRAPSITSTQSAERREILHLTVSRRHHLYFLTRVHCTTVHKLTSVTKCGDKVCGRKSGFRQKMGHRHEHQRALPIVSLSKYTEFSLCGWTQTHAPTRSVREREREWHNQPLERQVFSSLCHKLLMPPCCQSVNCIFKWRPAVRPWLTDKSGQPFFGLILLPETLNVWEILVVLCLYTFRVLDFLPLTSFLQV